MEASTNNHAIACSRVELVPAVGQDQGASLPRQRTGGHRAAGYLGIDGEALLHADAVHGAVEADPDLRISGDIALTLAREDVADCGRTCRRTAGERPQVQDRQRRYQPTGVGLGAAAGRRFLCRGFSETRLRRHD